MAELTGAEGNPVSAEHMEISRLRAELARVKMERDILGKCEADQPTLRWSIGPVNAYFAKVQR